jgi:signal transduction histidine kinase
MRKLKNAMKKKSVKSINPCKSVIQTIKDKIFQSFFPTKPTGQGTGLGLSLSYDIITKGHHGHLEVDTTEGFGTEFIIEIPF